MTLMIVTFFNASGIDFGNFLNAHLESKILSPNYVTSTAMAGRAGLGVSPERAVAQILR